MPEVNTRDLKLIQYLNEAYGTEKQLEVALEAHIAMTARASYRKRLRQHLSETKRHAHEVDRRIRALGGRAETVSLPGPDGLTDAAQAAQGLVGRAAAAAQGPLHALRGTGEDERQLKNAKTEYASEAEEIATYSAIETLAESVGDRATAKLAKAIRREEERMAGFLERLIPQLTKAVAHAEIPAAERNGAGGRRRRRARSQASRRASGGGGRSTTRKRSASRQ